MCSCTLIFLLSFLAHARANSNRHAEDSTVKLLDKLASGVSLSDHSDLDRTTLGKPGHFGLATTVSQQVSSAVGAFPSPFTRFPLKAWPLSSGQSHSSSVVQARLLVLPRDAARLPPSPDLNPRLPALFHSCPTRQVQVMAEAPAIEEIGAVGSKLTNQDLAVEALGFWVDNPEKVPMEPTSGGVNNIVQYVTLPEGKKLLRIYNNGLDTPRVKVEHAILEKLNNDFANQLDFKVPNFLKSKSGPSFVKLSNGAEACMCDFIEGELPKLTCVEAIGKASGELCTAMSKLKDIDLTGSSDPYWDMWKVHHFGGRSREEAEKVFVAEMEGPNFDGELRPYATEMLEETIAVTRKCENEYKDFPEQLIHADIHYDNVLVKDGKVSAILDFEFAAFDWRAMELAVCLSKYAGEPNAMGIFDEFTKGYAQTAQLTKAEVLAMPDLINLRVLSNVVYFVGRAITNEDKIDSLTKRIENYSTRVRWIKEHEKQIQDILVKNFGV